MGSLKEKWISKYDDIEKSFSRDHGVDGWQNATLSTTVSYLLFEYGLITLCAFGLNELAERYFYAAINAARNEMLLCEESIERNPDLEPINRGLQAKSLRVGSYSQYLLGEPLDINALIRAAMHIRTDCNSPPRGSLEIESENRLAALQMSLICDDLNLARLLLKDTRQNLRKYPGFRLNIELYNLIKNNSLIDHSLQSRFTEEFRQLRDPNNRSVIAMIKFEWACLYDKYFVSEDRQLNRDRVIKALVD